MAVGGPLAGANRREFQICLVSAAQNLVPPGAAGALHSSLGCFWLPRGCHTHHQNNTLFFPHISSLSLSWPLVTEFAAKSDFTPTIAEPSSSPPFLDTKALLSLCFHKKLKANSPCHRVDQAFSQRVSLICPDPTSVACHLELKYRGAQAPTTQIHVIYTKTFFNPFCFCQGNPTSINILQSPGCGSRKGNCHIRSLSTRLPRA